MASSDPNKNAMDVPLFKFKESLPSIRCHYAVVYCGKIFLHLIMTVLIQGDINDIKGCLQKKLSSNKQYKNSFTKDEHTLLDGGEHKKWDVSLLFKIIQKICGLEPCTSQTWTTHNFGEESLEYLIYTLKEMRNAAAHTFGEIIPEDEMEERLTALTNLALRLMSAFEIRAQILGRQVSDKESSETINSMFNIVNDVRERINEGQDGPVAESVQPTTTKDEDMCESVTIQSDKSELQFDNVYVPAGAGGQTHREPSWQEKYEDLERKFWLCAGRE